MHLSFSLSLLSLGLVFRHLFLVFSPFFFFLPLHSCTPAVTCCISSISPRFSLVWLYLVQCLSSILPLFPLLTCNGVRIVRRKTHAFCLTGCLARRAVCNVLVGALRHTQAKRVKVSRVGVVEKGKVGQVQAGVGSVDSRVVLPSAQVSPGVCAVDDASRVASLERERRDGDHATAKRQKDKQHNDIGAVPILDGALHLLFFADRVRITAATHGWKIGQCARNPREEGQAREKREERGKLVVDEDQLIITIITRSSRPRPPPPFFLFFPFFASLARSLNIFISRTHHLTSLS